MSLPDGVSANRIDSTSRFWNPVFLTTSSDVLMADVPVVHIGENSPQQVAYKLLEQIAKVEKKVFYHQSHRDSDDTTADRKWILDTYAECLYTVNGYRDWTKKG